ncbi:MAG: lipoprotein signal peptidase [Betaproteobacteria bacterium]|nr:lipoprotein signal peptidase [Betaproteobacteria bacterium]
MKQVLRSFIGWLAVAAAIVVLDQASKWVILGALRLGEVHAVNSFFNLVLTFNSGAAFSFLSDASGWQRTFFIGIALVASTIIVALLWRNSGERVFCAGLALILGGALGNLWDRIDLGYVVDFLDFHALGYHWPAFNAADSAITVGAVLLIVDSFRPRAKRGS